MYVGVLLGVVVVVWESFKGTGQVHVCYRDRNPPTVLQKYEFSVTNEKW